MNEQEAGQPFAIWVAPDGLSRIVYSLGVFHEIDFVVNEGFRRIPHGGIETGGLLFGASDAGSARIQAFRPIESEHAFGPSFVLSRRDIDSVKEQIATASNDPDLSGMQVLGWFVAHTRSPLQISEREQQAFDELFPQPASIALLVKPERFQPTRFAFLVRDASGAVETDGTQRAIILPLPGRPPANGSDPVPSMPAPKSAPAPARAPARGVTREIPALQVPPPPPPPEEAAPSIPLPPPAPQEETAAPPLPAAPTHLPAPPYRSAEFASPFIPRTDGAAASAFDRSPSGYLPSATRRVASETRPQSTVTWRFVAVLLLSAILGCAAGYWCYLQLPSPMIPLSLRQQSGKLIVAWPSAQTAGVSDADIRVNDGDMRPLTAAEKTAGEMTLDDSAGDVKIELVAHHWLRDSRGIVRFLKLPARAPGAPAEEH